MAQFRMNEVRVLGDYEIGRQLGSGSFSVVWHGRHRLNGRRVAIKEINLNRLNNKLQDSLMSEISILKRVNHPNIIQLEDIIQVPGKIHLVLEYCKGGDLSVYIQRHGRVREATAKCFMQQLAAGLKVLRDNNLIHRDLKPQNLLLSSNGSSSILKIADFGFARFLQPRGLAETLCGSPLYMAPEIMQLQKYDAKADLWSVGVILYHLVTGKPPFMGNNQIQLLQNIVKTTDLHFPLNDRDLSSDCKDLCQKLLHRNPVERLTFEEFFNHPFLLPTQPDEFLSSQEDVLPFILDDDSNGADGSSSFNGERPSMRSTYGFSLDPKVNRRVETSKICNNREASTSGTFTQSRGHSGFNLDSHRPSYEILKGPSNSIDRRSPSFQSKILDSLELIDREYVLVPGPLLDTSSFSMRMPKPSHSQCIDKSPSKMIATSSYPMPMVGSGTDKTCDISSLESQSSAPSRTSQGSMDIVDSLEKPSSHCMTRIKSLQQCASAITDLVNEKIEASRQLEAFSIQLVILAIWKQALHICHTEAASALEGSLTQEISKSWKKDTNMQGHLDVVNALGTEDICFQIEKEFFLQVENGEELSKVIDPESRELPDAMETIYQSALAFGRHGAVDEVMGDVESADLLYSKAVQLLLFLIVEAPCLNMNPPFSLTNSDRYRLRTYIDSLNNRQSYSRSQRMSLLKCENEP